MLTPDEARQRAIDQTKVPDEVKQIIDDALVAAASKLQGDQPIDDVHIQLHDHVTNKAVLLAAKRLYEESDHWSVEVDYRPGQGGGVAQLTFKEILK